MKKVLLAASIFAFVGGMSVSTLATANGIEVVKGDDKKKKCKKKKSCSKEAAKKSCCSKEGAKKSCSKDATKTAE